MQKTKHPEVEASGCFAAQTPPEVPSSSTTTISQVITLAIGSLNLLGLDAVLVGLCWQQAASTRLEVTLNWSERILLASALWLAYIADRAGDVRRYQRIDESAIPPRHAFLWRHQLPFAAGFVFVAITSAVIAMATCTPQLWLAAILLAFVSLGYLFICQLTPTFGRRILTREVVVAALFLAGTVLFPFVKSQPHPTADWYEWLAWAWLILWLNALGISVWEEAGDRRLGEITGSTERGFVPRNYRWLLAMVIALCAVRLTLIPGDNRLVVTQVMISAGLILLVDRLRPTWIKPALADLSVLTPWFI